MGGCDERECPRILGFDFGGRCTTLATLRGELLVEDVECEEMVEEGVFSHQGSWVVVGAVFCQEIFHPLGRADAGVGDDGFVQVFGDEFLDFCHFRFVGVSRGSHEGELLALVEDFREDTFDRFAEDMFFDISFDAEVWRDLDGGGGEVVVEKGGA